MEGCCIKGCKNFTINGNNNVACFKFPLHDKVLLQWWLKQINQTDLKPTKHTQICIDHFEGNDINCNLSLKNIKLSPTAIPTIFPPQFEEICNIDSIYSTVDNDNVDINDNNINRGALMDMEREEDTDLLYYFSETTQEQSEASVDSIYNKLPKPEITWTVPETQTKKYCTILPKQRNDSQMFPKTVNFSDSSVVVQKQEDMSMQIDEFDTKPERFNEPETCVAEDKNAFLKITIEKCNNLGPSTRQSKRGRPFKKRTIVITPSTDIEHMKDSYVTFNVKTSKTCLAKTRSRTLNRTLPKKEQNTEGYESKQLSPKKSDLASVVPIPCRSETVEKRILSSENAVDTEVKFTRDIVEEPDVKHQNGTTIASTIQKDDYKSLVVKNLNAQKKSYAAAVLLQHGTWKAEDEEFETLIRDVRKLKEDAIETQRKRQRKRHFIKGTTKAEDDEFEKLIHDIKKIKEEIIKKKTSTEIHTGIEPINASPVAMKNGMSSNGTEITADREFLECRQQQSSKFSDTSNKTVSIGPLDAANERCHEVSSVNVSSQMKNNVRNLDGTGNSSIKIIAPVEKSSPVILASVHQIFRLADQKNPKSFNRFDEGEVICEVKEDSSDDFTLEFNTDQELLSDSELELTNNSDPDLIIT